MKLPDVKIAVIIPDRGDRPEFMRQCIKMLADQTLQPVRILKADRPPDSPACDITQRYREGYESIPDRACDLISFVENDDWYSPNYLAEMAAEWIRAGRPDLMGTTYSWYYHIGLLKYTRLEHFTRSAAMNTFIKPGMDFKWCPDNEPYTDQHLWNNLPQLSKHLFAPEKIISMGIKHGVGKCGGGSHTDRLNKYKFDDPRMEHLRNTVGIESIDFYRNMNKKLNFKYQ